MAKSNIKTDDLIKNLCEDHKKIKPMGCALKRAFIILVGIIIYNTIAVNIDVVRSDVELFLSNQHNLFELILAFSIGATSIVSTSLLMVPDMNQKKWLLTVPVTLLGVLLVWVLLSFLEQGYESEHIHIGGACFIDGIVYAALPTAFMIFLTRKGATTLRHWQTLMATLSVVSFGWISLRFVCSIDNASHIFIDHVFPFVLIGLGLGLFSRRLFSW